MEKQIYRVALCDFSPITGWRLRAYSYSDYKQPAVWKFGKIKLLRIPTSKDYRPGSFIPSPRYIHTNLS